MKHYQYFIAGFIITLLSCTKKDTSTADVQSTLPDVVTLTPEQIKNANITVGPYEQDIITTSIQVSGKLEAPPQNMVTISAPFGGFIKSIDLLQGMAIKKGAVVVELQHPDYIAFQQNYLELKSELEFLEVEYQRQQKLAKDSINSLKTLQSAKSHYQVAKAKLDGLRARLNLMNIDLTRVEKGEFSSTINLYSPFDGNITEVNVNLGEFVNPNDAIVKIVDTRHLHVEIKIFEKDIFKIKPGQIITFTLNGDNQTRKASVYLIGKEISPDRTIIVHGHLEKEDAQLLPGMFLTAGIETNPEKVPVLPEEAIVKFEGDSFIFTMDKPGQYKMVNVKTGIIMGNKVEMIFSEGMSANTQIVLTGAYNLLSVLKNGQSEE